jgi:hypothetical protein
MKKGMFALGAAIGVGVAYWYSTTRSAERREKGVWTPPPEKHAIQGEDERETVAALIDEVVHEPDAPDTPVKQAFEHALEER